jgi:hypothetical protein
MATCDYCKSTILLGGSRVGDLRFCNDKCRAKGSTIILSRQIPQHVVDQQVSAIHHGLCPSCKGIGPVDVHMSYRVWSAILLTRWQSIPTVSCRACGKKKQIFGALFSALFGWWGFPWGLVMTPLQIVRNIGGLIRGPDPRHPSDKLQNLVRLHMASQLADAKGAPDSATQPTG